MSIIEIVGRHSPEPIEGVPLVITKRQFEEVFRPASRSDITRLRSNYVTLFAVRIQRISDFDSVRRRSIENGKDNIALDFAKPEDAIVVGFRAKNEKDLNTFNVQVGKRQKKYFAQKNISLVFQEGRKRL